MMRTRQSLYWSARLKINK